MRKIATTLSILTAALCLGLIFTACDNEANNKALLAQEWTVEKIVYKDGNKESVAPENVFIVFSDSISVHGRFACNNFTGRYKATGKDQIKMGAIGSTMMLCPNMEFENEFSKILEAVATYKASAAGMTLYSADKKTEIVCIPRVIKPASTPEQRALENAVDQVEDAVEGAVEDAGNLIEEGADKVKKEAEKIIK